MMAIVAAARTRDIVIRLVVVVMLALLRGSSSLRSSRKRPFALTQQSFFWSSLRGGGAEPDLTTLDVSIGRKPAHESLVYPVSVCSVRGLRDHMEDDFFVAPDFAAVFDGIDELTGNSETAANTFQRTRYWTIRTSASPIGPATTPDSPSRVGDCHSFCQPQTTADPLAGIVITGHGGEAVSKYLRQNLYASMQASLPSSAVKKSSSGGSLDPKALETLKNSLTVSRNESAADPSSFTLKDYEKALVRALNKVDREIIRISHWSFQGSTAVACWILPMHVVDEDDEDDEAIPNDDDDETLAQLNQFIPRIQPPRRTHTLLTANIGDSRAVLSRNKTAIIELTRDHKPNDPLEKQRIERVGGTIVWHGNIDRHGNPIPGTGVWRVNGNLALARAIGDRAERPAVTSEPELSIIQLTEDDDFVIIGTDGLWDVMSSGDCVAFVHALIEEAEEMGTVDYDAIAYMLVEEALRRGSYDNITVVLIWLHDHDQGTTIATGAGDSTSSERS